MAGYISTPGIQEGPREFIVVLRRLNDRRGRGQIAAQGLSLRHALHVRDEMRAGPLRDLWQCWEMHETEF